ncbi:MAG TPA: PPE family protein [Mycobacterium sp.]|nr:PPE family protein [Mycobacterium sp.]
MIDYGLLPPEVNSGRLYAGAGSAPMMAAASAWRALAGEITSALTSYETTISQLVDEEWTGPASASMAAAAKPYLSWMTHTAATAEQAANQATTAAAAFETAHAATPPPAVIAANRIQHAHLVATNTVGQNIAAIMANEAQYQQMWAKAAGVMYGYAGTSATAAQLTPFTQPAQNTNPAGQGAQAAATAQATAAPVGQITQAMSTMQSSLQSLSAPASVAPPAASASLGDLWTAFLTNASVNGIASLVTDPMNGVLSFAGTSLAFTPASLIPTMVSFFSGGGFNALGGGTIGSGLGALLAPGGPLSALGGLGGGLGGAAGAAGAASAGAAGAAATSAFSVSATAPAVSATMGQASLVGSFSAPASWAAATPDGVASGAAQPSGWAVAPEDFHPDGDEMAAMPGPAGIPAGEGRGFGLSTPRYGFKPTVMPRPVMVG